MRLQRLTLLTIPLLACVLLVQGRSLASDDPFAPPPLPAEEQPEVLTSGPVHEAFAEPVNFEAEDNVVAPNEPPPSVQEAPPAERPQGDSYVWVPGYWAWDAQQTNYIWISACWRMAPPNMTWVPGYWNRVPAGWEWVAGFWMPAGVQEIEYLPAPPAIDDIQPPVAAPSPDTVWVPSCWYWRSGRYVRRAGYWIAPQRGWLWVPSHYAWTPRGYVFIMGHWDHPLERRGVLFAPARIPRATVLRAGFIYTPAVVVDLNVLTVNLFTHPRYHHYYFGDFYDDAYVRIGIHPWFDRAHIRGWYDPIYVHDRWRYRAEPKWEDRIRHDYDIRRADRNLRPPRTYRELETRVARMPEPQRKNIEVARSLSTVVTSKTSTVKFERINTETRRTISKESTAVRKYRDERSHWEATATSARTTRTPDRTTPPDRARTPDKTGPREVRATKPERVKVPPSPIQRKRPAGADKDKDKQPPRRPANERNERTN